MGWRGAVCGGEQTRAGGTWLKEWLSVAFGACSKDADGDGDDGFEGDDDGDDGRSRYVATIGSGSLSLS